MKPLISAGRRWMIPVLAAVILGLGFVGVALSGDRSGSSQRGTGSGDHEIRFLDYLADELDVSKQALLGAAQRAAERTLDDLDAAGKLTDEQADIIRDRLTRLAADPGSLRELMRAVRRDAAPYGRLLHRVREEVGGEATRIRSLVQRGRLDEAARRSGATPSELRAAARSAARPVLARAVSEGLITRLQARVAMHKTLAVVGHLVSP